MLTYGIKNEADVRVLELLMLTEGGTYVRLRHPGGEISFTVRLHGLYNVYNSLAAAAWAEGIDADKIAAGIESLNNVPGRQELLPSPLGIENRHFFIRDRLQAIHYAINCAQAGDIVLITGKGRENYQLVGNRVIQYSDPQAVETFLN